MAEEDPALALANRPTALVAVLLFSWTLVTAVELALGITPLFSMIATALETFGLLSISGTVIFINRRQYAATAPARRATAKRAQWRSYGLHMVLLLFMAGCLAAQYDVLLHARGSTEVNLVKLSASYRSYVLATLLLVIVGLLTSTQQLTRLLASMATRPARLVALPFVLCSIAGALLLSLPISLNHIHDVSLLDGLFNSVSAVCVTGLAVNNVAETYSFFGQAVLLALMQIGGLGIAVLFAFFGVAAGRRLHAKRAVAMAEMLDVKSLTALRRIILGIVALTLTLELVGALVLYVAFGDYPDVALDAGASSAALAGAGGRWWAAVFHAVSAFCNAGFSNFRAGAMPFASDGWVSSTIMLLIFLGGIGFPVLFELLGRARDFVKRERRKRLSLSSRIALSFSALLVLVGALFFVLLESPRAFAQQGWPDKIMSGVFQSVTCRTAGFSTADFGAMGPATLMLACLLMFIGASPGSTGGGSKTTTWVVLFASFRAELRNRDHAELWGRTVSPRTIRKAMAIVFISLGQVVLLLFAMMLVEDHKPLDIVFEVISAFTTAGLSTGITPDLNAVGKGILCLTMLIGRIGPLTIAAALARPHEPTRYRLLEEHVAVG